MKFDLLPLAALTLCAVLGVACWVGILYLLAVGVSTVYRALVTWPVVQFAGIVAAFGFGWLVLSEQVAELYANAREREE